VVARNNNILKLKIVHGFQPHFSWIIVLLWRNYTRHRSKAGERDGLFE
jgi:hypothetical protein